MAVDSGSFLFFCTIPLFSIFYIFTHITLCSRFSHLFPQQMLSQAQRCHTCTVNNVRCISKSTLTTAELCIYGFVIKWGVSAFFQLNTSIQYNCWNEYDYIR